MNFGTLIKDQRKLLCLTLSDAAERLAISSGYLSDLETGRKPAPPAERLQDFIQVFRIKDHVQFYDLAAASRTGSKNGIPADIYNFIKNNPSIWKDLRDKFKDWDN